MNRGTIAAIVLALGASLAMADPLETPGRLDEVTVYRGQALVTRLAEVPGPAGLREIVITGLPDRVVPGSIFAESADGVVVRSVRYRVRPVSEDIREEVRAIDGRIQEVKDKQQTNARQTALTQEFRAYLDKLEQFTAPTANAELTQGVLNADTLKTLTLFLFEQRQRLADEELRLAREQRELGVQADLLQRQRAELTSGTARTVREAVVFADLQRPEGGLLRVRYLVDQATWSPSYNVRTAADRAQVTVEYNASIQQMSGEDWSDVAMTLSTATPSLVAKAPTLTPLTVSLARAAEPQPPPGKDFATIQKELGQRKRQLEGNRGGNLTKDQQASLQMQAQMQTMDQFDYAANAENDLMLNKAAGDMQVLELVTRERIGASERGKDTGDEGVSVTYRLEGRTTLPSRSDRQLIQIASLPMKGEFHKLAMPVLTEYVYEEAAVTNSSTMVLLAGPALAYVAGQFMGHGDIPTVAAGETFTVGFGIDSALRASRELVKKRDTIQGGNRVVTFTYRLAVENFGDQPADIRLVDRLPNAKESEVKVTLTPGKVELCSDQTYLKTQRNKGILRWDMQIPAQVSGTEAKAIEYEFQLEYDKELAITGLAMAGD